MLGFDLLTLIVIGATLFTVIVMAMLGFWAEADESAAIVFVIPWSILFILLTVEVLYLIIRCVKFLWVL